jgi:hypothetical protein
MQIKDAKTKKIILDHGDLILQDLSASAVDINYDGKKYFYYHDDKKLLLELTDNDKRYLNELFEFYKIVPNENVYTINSALFSEENEEKRFKSK